MDSATRSTRIRDLSSDQLAVVRAHALQEVAAETAFESLNAPQLATFADEHQFRVITPPVGVGVTTVRAVVGHHSLSWIVAPPEPLAATSFLSDPDQVALDEMHYLTGEDWSEIASWVGVSRISVSNWRSGTGITAANRLRLHRLLRSVRIASGRKKAPLAQWLGTPVAGGVTPRDLLRRGALREFEAITAYIPEPAFVTGTPWDELAASGAAGYAAMPHPSARTARGQSLTKRARFREDDAIVLEEEPELFSG